MSQLGILKETVSVLKRENIPFMIVGSFVSSLYGEPRSTQDIDLVIQLEKKHIPILLSSFQPPKYYLDEELILMAMESKKMFNLLDTEEGDKIDFYIIKNEAYEKEKFSRKVNRMFLEEELPMLSAEDLIISKLIWCIQSGRSERQLRDAAGVYRVQKNFLDLQYMERKIKELNLTDLYNEVKKGSERSA